MRGCLFSVAWTFSSTYAVHQICSVSSTSNFWPGLQEVTTCFSFHSECLFNRCSNLTKSSSSDELYSSFRSFESLFLSFFCALFDSQTMRTASSTYVDFSMGQRRISRRQPGHSFLRKKHSVMHSSQKECPHTAVRHDTMKSRQMLHTSSTFLLLTLLHRESLLDLQMTSKVLHYLN